jgi:hypothetical protein
MEHGKAPEQDGFLAYLPRPHAHRFDEPDVLEVLQRIRVRPGCHGQTVVLSCEGFVRQLIDGAIHLSSIPSGLCKKPRLLQFEHLGFGMLIAEGFLFRVR